MRKRLLLMSALLATPAALSAQDALLYTTYNLERSRFQPYWTANYPSLRNIDREDVMLVIPSNQPLPGAKKFAPHDAFTTLCGDTDNDSRIWESSLARWVDALSWVKGGTGRSMRQLYISPAIKIEANVAGDTMYPGDIARVVHDGPGLDGKFKYLLREDQIRTAFNIPASQSVNVDAVAALPQYKMIFFSLEDNVQVTVHNSGGPYTFTARDGSILGLYIGSWGEPVTPIANGARMVMRENQVNAAVVASLVRNHLGAPVLAIQDLDGLDIHPQGGTFTNFWGTWPNLMFSGLALTGGAISSTNGIPQINGVAMANTVGPTTGTKVGLVPNARSLNGLHVRQAANACHFVTETPRPVITGGGTMRVDIGGGTPGVAILFVNIYAMPVHPFNAAVFNSCFPETLWPAPLWVGVPIDPDGLGNWQVAVPAVDLKLIFQSATILGAAGGWKLSTPCTVELYN